MGRPAVMHWCGVRCVCRPRKRRDGPSRVQRQRHACNTQPGGDSGGGRPRINAHCSAFRSSGLPAG
eukprot:13679725-Alexandrium_andersonii.AAC.1